MTRHELMAPNLALVDLCVVLVQAMLHTQCAAEMALLKSSTNGTTGQIETDDNLVRMGLGGLIRKGISAQAVEALRY